MSVLFLSHLLIAIATEQIHVLVITSVYLE